MEKNLCIGLFLCIQFAFVEPGIGGMIAAVETVRWAKGKWNDIQDGWNWVQGLMGYGDGSDSQIKEYNDHIYRVISNDLSDFAEKIDELKQYRKQRYDDIAKLVVDLRRIRQINAASRILGDRLTAVQLEFKQLRKKLPKLHEKLATIELCSYGNDRLTGNNLKLKIEAIIREVMPDSLFRPDLWKLLQVQLQEGADSACGKGHSAYEYIHTFYNEIMITEMEGYIALLFSHYFVYNYNGTYGCDYYFDVDARTAVSRIFKDFEMRVLEYSKLFIDAMKHLRKDFRECDGASLERGLTFHELEGAVQTVGLLPPESTCGEISGSNYQLKTFCTTNNQCYSLPRTCLGSIGDCQEHLKETNFCTDDKYSSRRYKWFNTAEEAAAKSKCPRKLYRVMPKSTYICLCPCYDNHPTSMSSHTFNLQSVEADIENNKVLTGVRFVIKHRVLQLQIQQGELTDYWRIKNPQWKPIDDISEQILASRTNTLLRGERVNLTEFKDYYVMKYPSRLRLNDITVPEDHILTGVKFDWELDQKILRLAIISRPFTHTSGRLNCTSTPKISYGPTADMKLPFDAANPLTFNTSTEVPSKNGWIQFQESDWASDSGQTTVPLFDAIPLVSSPPSPLGGIGIFLKTAPKSAVLLSLKFLSLDYGNYIKKSVDDLQGRINEEAKKLPLNTNLSS